MSRSQYGGPREPAFEDYYRAVPRSQGEPEHPGPRRELRVEERYSRGRSMPREPEPRLDDSEDSETDDEYEVKYRRQLRRTRARSADSARSRKGANKGALVRYRSKHRYETEGESSSDEEVVYSDEEDRRSSKSSRSSVSNAADKMMIKPTHKGAMPCGPHCNDNAHRQGAWQPPRAFALPGDDSDYDSEKDHEERKKRRNKRILYTGLAGVATVAACNNIYQNTKAHKTRKAMLAHGMVCESEAKNMRRKAFIEDAIALGVVAVGVSNVVKGWKRTTALKQQDAECRAKWEEKRNTRDRSLGRLEPYEHTH